MKIPSVRIRFTEEDRQAIFARVADSLITGSLTLGRNVREFEEAFGERMESPHAVATSSGTSALEIAMRCLGVKDGKVIVPTNTFIATSAAVIHAGGGVKFADADPDTMAIDPAHAESLISQDTVGIITVHIGGVVSPRTMELREICDRNNIWLFEDACHAIGSILGTKCAGTFGIGAAFSFYPTKVITSGEGGMLVTNEENLASEARKYRDQGKRSFGENLHDVLGSNWRMSEIHAAIGLQHLTHLDEFIEERNEIASFYDEVLKSLPGITPLAVPDECISNYYKYIAVLDDGSQRPEVKLSLREDWGVSISGGVYDTPCHRQPVFNSFVRQDPLPKAEDICARHICLPIYNGMEEEEYFRVVEALSGVLRGIAGKL